MKYMSIVSIGLVLLFAAVASAGDLDNHAAAYNGWTGSESFSTGTLAGYIDYAVFTAADFDANFDNLGYAPGDDLVYTYQVFNTGEAVISAEILGIANPANTIGTFDIGDWNASSMFFDGTGNANWQFLAPNAIPTGDSSWGLAYSSPNIPEAGAGLTVDSGQNILVTGLPTPSGTPIPEPSSLVLLAVGMLVTLGCFRRRLPQ